MTENDIFNNTYKLRTSVLKELIPLLGKKVNYDKIIKLYQNYILCLNLKHTNYLDIFIPNIKTLKHNKINDNRTFLCFIYDLVANIHNAYIFSLEDTVDTSKFFLGFSIYELEDFDIIDKLIFSFRNRESYDIDLLELTSIRNKEDAKIIIDYKLIDIYLLQQLSNYNSNDDLLEIIKQIYYIDDKYHNCNKNIIDLIIKLLSLI